MMNKEIPVEVKKYFEWVKTMERPFCFHCKKSDDGKMIIINNAGAYGLEEVLMCKECIELPENEWARERLKEICDNAL